MSQRGVERTLGRLVTDQGFRQDFFADPAAAALGLGADLTREEIDALLRVPLAALTEFSVRLDDRICRLHIRQDTLQQEWRQ